MHLLDASRKWIVCFPQLILLSSIIQDYLDKKEAQHYTFRCIRFGEEYLCFNYRLLGLYQERRNNNHKYKSNKYKNYKDDIQHSYYTITATIA